MIGAICGDIIGSIYESSNFKSTDFDFFNPRSFFTDDTVLTCAIAKSIISSDNYWENLKFFTKKYPNAGYGENFTNWAFSDSQKPYNSWGNGSAMRVSPIGFAFDDLETVLFEAKRSAEVTHNHPQGILGAQATASAIFLARSGKSKKEIKEFIESEFDYDLSIPLDDIRISYIFDVSCQGTVPQAIRAFLESKNFENSIRLSISIGGDSDTIGCINGGIAQAFYNVIPKEIQAFIYLKLDDFLLNIVKDFCSKFNCFLSR